MCSLRNLIRLSLLDGGAVYRALDLGSIRFPQRELFCHEMKKWQHRLEIRCFIPSDLTVARATGDETEGLSYNLSLLTLDFFSVRPSGEGRYAWIWQTL